MIDQQTLLQILQSLHQRNAQPDGGITGATPVSPTALGQMGAPQTQVGAKPSALGFLGGLGDTKNDQGGYDPSWLTQANQFVTGQGQQSLPWQQPASQQLGQSVLNGGMMGGISKFLSALL